MLIRLFVTIASIVMLASMPSCQSKKGTNLQSAEAGTSEAATIGDMYFINMYGDTIRKIMKSDEEWKKELSDLEYHVLREKGTERPHVGKYTNEDRKGIYVCKGCGMPLFSSKDKFHSTCGWPSFSDIMDMSTIVKQVDYVIGYPRIELTCAKCGSHLGHVFDDGPQPTGLRYCINSISLDFIEEKN